MTTYLREAPDRLYRVSLGPNAILLRSWRAAGVIDRLGSKTFGHRWDDPKREFRSLYTASSRNGAFIETLQDLRPNFSFLGGLDELELEPREERPSHYGLDASYFDNLYLCDIAVQTQAVPFIDVLDADVIGMMRNQLGNIATSLDLRTVDASTMLGPDREFTQAVARAIWEAGYAGITSLSALGHPYQNWTVFESAHETSDFRAELTVVNAEPITLDNTFLIDALNTLHMRIDRDTLLLRANPRELERADPGPERRAPS
jgi:RES domain